MSKELFNQELITQITDNLRIALGTPATEGAKNIKWIDVKTALNAFFIAVDGDQVKNGSLGIDGDLEVSGEIRIPDAANGTLLIIKKNGEIK